MLLALQSFRLPNVDPYPRPFTAGQPVQTTTSTANHFVCPALTLTPTHTLSLALQDSLCALPHCDQSVTPPPQAAPAALPPGAAAHHLPAADSLQQRAQHASPLPQGGTSRTVLICCCSPSADNAAETLSTLRFGARAKGLTCKVQVSGCGQSGGITRKSTMGKWRLPTEERCRVEESGALADEAPCSSAWAARATNQPAAPTAADAATNHPCRWTSGGAPSACTSSPIDDITEPATNHPCR